MIYGEVDGHEQSAETSAHVFTDGMTLFTVNGDIELLDLFAECKTPNGATASTLQFAVTCTGLAQQTISGASASLANAAAGTVVALDGTALATAPNIYTTGAGLGQTARGINMLRGVIQAIVGVGPMTGTWKCYLRYRPFSAGANVTGV